MKAEELKKLGDEELEKKEKGTKTLLGIFIALILALCFFFFRDYLRGEEMDLPILIIIICTIGGMFTVFQSLKLILNEKKERGS